MKKTKRKPDRWKTTDAKNKIYKLSLWQGRLDIWVNQYENRTCYRSKGEYPTLVEAEAAFTRVKKALRG